MPELTREQRDELRAKAKGATPGPWEARDMSDTDFDSEDGNGWWWVWRKDVHHYAGVLEMDECPNWGDDEAVPLGQIGEALITDTQNGRTERADAEYIAAVSPDVVLALLDALDQAEEAATTLAMQLKAVVKFGLPIPDGPPDPNGSREGRDR